MTCIEWPCDIRRVHVWSFLLFSICGRICEGQGVCMPMHILCYHNALISQGVLFYYRTYMHRELDGVVWVAPILVLVCYNIQDPHATCQCYDKVLVGGDTTMCNLYGNNFFVVQVKSSRVSGWCSVRKGGRPGAWILLFLIRWSHAAIYFSYCPHVDMVRWW